MRDGGYVSQRIAQGSFDEFVARLKCSGVSTCNYSESASLMSRSPLPKTLNDQEAVA